MDSETKQKNNIKINYSLCNKPGLLHENQPCNIVCLEPECGNDPLCCCFCVLEFHKNHQTKLLKLFLSQALQQSQSYQMSSFNSDIILDVIYNNKKQMLEEFYCQRKTILTLLDRFQGFILTFYKNLTQRFAKNQIDLKKQINYSISVLSQGQRLQNCHLEVKKLADLLYCLQSQKLYCKPTQTDIIGNLIESSQNIRKIVREDMQKVIVDWTKTCYILHQEIQQSKIFNLHQNYEFSANLKHPNIEIINKCTAKSIDTQSYKFALLNPCVEAGFFTNTVQFIIQQCTNGWIALGICHKNIIKMNNFTINPNDLGHGAYIISSLGGVWSNHMQQFNNKLKSFKFGKGDKIKIRVNLHKKKITFTKNLQKFQLPFQILVNDQLHPCVLFYNINDKVTCTSCKL